MFAKEIKFPEDFKVVEMKNQDNYHTVIGMKNDKWGIEDTQILVKFKDLGVGHDAMICIGKEVYQVFGDLKEVMEKVNYHVCKLFRKKAMERNLYYKY